MTITCFILNVQSVPQNITVEKIRKSFLNLWKHVRHSFTGLYLKQLSLNISYPRISKIWSAFFVLSKIAEIIKISFEFQFIKQTQNNRFWTYIRLFLKHIKGWPHFGNTRTMENLWKLFKNLTSKIRLTNKCSNILRRSKTSL